MKNKTVFLLVIFCLPALVMAQERVLSDQARISMITILPGEAPEELFGHSAFRVLDISQDLDLLFNYGTFEFDSYFLPKFIYGELNYFLSVANTPRAIEYYRQRRRPVTEQVLNLTQEQTQSLYDFLLINAREENRYYRYDFLFDNCSTRIRDAMESVMNDDLEFIYEADPEHTFREMLDPYLNHRPFLDMGIDLLLGERTDRIPHSRELMFLPDSLKKAFDEAIIHTEEGYSPLVAAENILLQIEDYEKDNQPPYADIFSWAILLTGAVVTFRASRKNESVQRWFDVPLFFLTGFIGLLICFLWFVSLHEVTANNLNLFWAWPTNLLFIPVLLRRSMRDFSRFYFGSLAITCLGLLLGWFIWMQPLHSAVFPLLLLIVMRSGWIAASSG